MAESRLLRLWAALIGVVLFIFLSWMLFALFLHAFSIIGDGGVASLFADAIFQHKLGELLIVATLIGAVYVGVLRPPAQGAAFFNMIRWPLRVGALLNLVAWLPLRQGTRWGTWSMILAIVGVAAPVVLARVAARGITSVATTTPVPHDTLAAPVPPVAPAVEAEQPPEPEADTGDGQDA